MSSGKFELSSKTQRVSRKHAPSQDAQACVPIVETSPPKWGGPETVPSQFTFLAPTALQVSLVGDFNDWDSQSMPMGKGRDGMWRRHVLLKPGRHEYRFLADGHWHDDPAATKRIVNASGTENCVRTIIG